MKSMAKSISAIIMALMAIQCQPKKKDNNEGLLAFLALSQSVTYRASGRMVFAKETFVRKPGVLGDNTSFDVTTESSNFEVVIPNALLEVTVGNRTIEVEADQAGAFVIPSIRPGTYSVKLTRKRDDATFPAILNQYNCTGVNDVTSINFSTIRIPTNCVSQFTVPRDSIAPVDGSDTYQIATFNIVITTRSVSISNIQLGADVTTQNSRYNLLPVNTSATSYIYDVFTTEADNLKLLNGFVEVNRVVPVDVACDRTNKDCLKSLINGNTWVMTGKAQIPANLLGFPETVFNVAALCYHKTRFVARNAPDTDAVFSVENIQGTLNTGPGNAYCDNDTPVTPNATFGPPTVSTSVVITPVRANCFDININYNLVRQEGRGNVSDDGNTLRLELYNGGINPSNHRCANGEVGDTNAVPNGSFPSVTVQNNAAFNQPGRPASAVQTYSKQ